MAERAHPDDPAFRPAPAVRFRLRRGFIPWISLNSRNPFRDAFLARYEWVCQHASGKRVLDVPCGMGWGTSLIRGAAELVGVDLDAASIDEARQRYGSLATFQPGDMSRLDFEAGRFDLVCCLEGIEHVPLDVGEAFLSESARVLAPGGMLLLSSPHCPGKAHSGNPFHIHEYLPDEIKAKVSRWFRIDESFERPVGNLIVTYIRATKAIA